MLSTFSGLPRTAWIVFAGTIVNRLGFMVTPFLVYYLGSRGISTDQVPYVLGALGAGNLVGPILGGLLADRRGRRPTMVTGLVGVAASHGLLFAAPNVLFLSLAAVLLSITGSMVSPAASALVAESVGPERRRSAFSLVHWAVNIGTAGAGMLGGFLATKGYWLLFLVDASGSLAYAVIAATLLPLGSRSKSTAADGGGIGYGVVFRDPLMRMLLPLFGVSIAIYSLTEAGLPLAIRDDGLSPTVLGLMATVNAVLVVILQPIATSVLSGLPQLRVYVAAGTLIAIGVALTGVADTAWGYAGTVVLWSVGEASIGGIHSSIIQSIAPEHARGRYQGAFQWSWGIARFSALTIGTAVYAHAGPAVLWWFSAVAGVAAALGVGALAPAINRRTAVPEPTPEPEPEPDGDPVAR
ncbi:MFS transporter [Streptomyces sp. NPDC101165]|uniref:MFS transporter n=1 Tax=Streptomyces sp. NPDC101165 TaxID=3366119 RepID=UPI0037F63C87